MFVGTEDRTDTLEVGFQTIRESASNPFPWLIRGLVLATAGYMISQIIVPEFLPSVNSDAMSGTSSLFLALVGLFTGSIVYMRIYDYVNIRNQQRDWTHDYANRRIDEIYAPIWVEAQGLIAAVTRFEDSDKWTGYVRLDKYGPVNDSLYGAVMRSHLRIFVDKHVRELSEVFQASIRDYKKSHQEAWLELYETIGRMSRERIVKGKTEGAVSQIYEPFRSNSTAIYNPDGGEAEGWAHEMFMRAYENVFNSKTKAEDEFKSIISELRSLDSVRRLQEKRTQCLENGEKVINRLKVIVRNPVRNVVLDFEG